MLYSNCLVLNNYSLDFIHPTGVCNVEIKKKIVTYGYWVYKLQAVSLEVLEVQVDLEDLGVHHNQCLVVLVVPGVQKGPLWTRPLDPDVKEKVTIRFRTVSSFLQNTTEVLVQQTFCY